MIKASLFAAAATIATPMFAQEAIVRIVAVPAASEVKQTIEHEKFEHQFVVEATKAASEIKFSVTDLVGTTRVSLACELISQTTDKDKAKETCQSFKLDAGEAKVVRLSGTIDQPGDYSAIVWVVHGSVRSNSAIVVKRAPTPLAVELVASVPAAATRESAVTFAVQLQEKFGRAAELHEPGITFSRRDGGKTTFFAAAPTVSISTPATRSLAGNWPISPREAPVLTLKVSNIDEAGEYRGNLRVSSASSAQVLDVPIVFTKSDAWSVAALFISVGVLASYLLQTLLKTVRPRLAQRRSAALLAIDIERLRSDLATQFGALTPAELRVIDGLKRRLEAVGELAGSDADAILIEIDSKLSLSRDWANASRRASMLMESQLNWEHALLNALQALLQPRTLDPQVASALKTTSELIDNRWLEESRQRPLTLEAAISESRFIEEDVKTRLRANVAVARTLFDGASGRSRLEQVEMELVTAQAEGLRRELQRQGPAPRGFEPLQWSSLARELVTQLDGVQKAPTLVERTHLFRGTARQYLKRLLKALQVRYDHLAALDLPENAVPEDWNTALEAIKKDLKSADDSLETWKLDAAGLAIEVLAKAILAMEARQQNATPESLKDSAPAPIPQGLVLQSINMKGFIRLEGRDDRLLSKSVSFWSSVIWTLDLAVLGAAVVISVAMGLKLLWADNPVWGNFNDYLVAILWGLGLHQVSNAAFEGVNGVIGRFSK